MAKATEINKEVKRLTLPQYIKVMETVTGMKITEDGELATIAAKILEYKLENGGKLPPHFPRPEELVK